MKILLLIVLGGLVLLQTCSSQKDLQEILIKPKNSIYSVYDVSVLDADKYKNKVLRVAIINGESPLSINLKKESEAGSSVTDRQANDYLQLDCPECSHAAEKRSALRLKSIGGFSNFKNIQELELGKEDIFPFKKGLRLSSIGGDRLDLTCNDRECFNGNRYVFTRIKFVKECPIDELRYISAKLKKQNSSGFNIILPKYENRKWIEFKASCAQNNELNILSKDINVSKNELETIIFDYFNRPRDISPPKPAENKMARYEKVYRELIGEFQGKKRTISENSNITQKLQESLSPFYSRLLNEFQIKKIQVTKKEEKNQIDITLIDDKKVVLENYQRNQEAHFELLTIVSSQKLNLKLQEKSLNYDIEKLYSDTYSYLEELILYLLVERHI